MSRFDTDAAARQPSEPRGDVAAPSRQGRRLASLHASLEEARVQTVLDMVRQAASRTPAKVAILDPRSGSELRYGDLLATVERVAAGFGMLGVQRGDRVAVVLPNSVE